MSRDTFSELYDRFDMFNTEVNEALLMVKSFKANPIVMTDEALFKARDRKPKIK